MRDALPPVTRILLIAIAAGFLLQALVGNALVANFALWPLRSDQVVRSGAEVLTVGFAPWQLVTYAFLHGDLMHLLLNAFALFMFGGAIERAFGTRRFAIYFVVCVIGAALAQLAVLAMTLPPGVAVPTVGASGGVFGLLLAFGVLFPHERILLLFPPIPMKAWIFVILYGLLELFLGIYRSGSGVAHFAHLGGMVAGAVLLLAWRRRARPRPRG